ncbi:MAG: hypothetical protein JWO46_3159, partial [Nocardioidaceae bacterium]|nr:hypothetical protein [Nocardioidaceae bacterium]
MTSTEIRDLRGDIRHWRRGRATVRPVELAQDIYVAVFSTLVIGAMVTNVVINLRRELGIACAGGACDRGRSVLPWLVALACVGAVLAVARLFGPVFVTPAVDSWLMSAPVDRRSLLRRRLATAAVLVVVVLPVVVGATFLGGAPTVGALGLSVVTTLLAVVLVALAAVSQSSSGPGAAGLALGIGAGLWLGMLDVATAHGPAPTVGGSGIGWTVGALAVALVAAGALVVADRRLGSIRRGRAATGGALAPGLSG